MSSGRLSWNQLQQSKPQPRKETKTRLVLCRLWAILRIRTWAQAHRFLSLDTSLRVVIHPTHNHLQDRLSSSAWPQIRQYQYRASPESPSKVWSQRLTRVVGRQFRITVLLKHLVKQLGSPIELRSHNVLGWKIRTRTVSIHRAMTLIRSRVQVNHQSLTIRINPVLKLSSCQVRMTPVLAPPQGSLQSIWKTKRFGQVSILKMIRR